jgi:hypothetical protein
MAQERSEIAMRKSLSLLIAVTTVFVFFAPPLLQAGSKEVAKVEAATEVLK